MNRSYTGDLFQLQSELFDSKVDMSVTKAIDPVTKSIDRVVEQIVSLRGEMHKELFALNNKIDTEIHALSNKMHFEINGLRRDMDTQFTQLKERVTAVESTLSFVKNTQAQIITKFIDYTFKGGWLLLAGSISYVVIHYFGLVN